MSYFFSHNFAPPTRVRWLRASLLAVGLAVSSAIAPVLANPLPSNNSTNSSINSSLFFEKSPRLIEVSTSQPGAFIPDGVYKITIAIPEDAGASLQAVTISQPKNDPKIVFAPNESNAIANGTEVSISAIGGESSEDVTIAFDTPIQPGSTVTISLPVERNARQSGFYSFGVTAYPVGDSTNGLYLGSGQVTLFDQDG